MDNKLARFPLLAAVTVAVAACSSGSSNHRSITSPSDGSGTTATITGTAAAGIISGATVSAFAISGGSVGSTAIGTGTTGSDGTYSVDIEDHEGAVKVVITAGTSTTMVCDAPEGCGSTAFGQSVSLSSNFSLSAMLPSVTADDTATAHITPLTHMAAVFAEEQSSISATVIEQAQTQLQSAMGISFNILETAPVDITDTDNLDDISEDQLTYSLYTAAVAGLAESEGSSGASFAANLDTVLTSLAEDFTENDGQLFQAASTTAGTDQVTLSEIFEAALSVIEAVEETATNAGVTLPTTVTQIIEEVEETIEAEKTIADLNAGSLTEGEPSDSSGETALAKAKGIVEDFRTIANILGDSNDEDFGDTLDDHFDTFDTFSRGVVLNNFNRVLVDVAEAVAAGSDIPTSASYNGMSYTIAMTGGSAPSEAGTTQVVTLPTGTITSENDEVLTLEANSTLTATFASATLFDDDSDLDGASTLAFSINGEIDIEAPAADFDTFDGSFSLAGNVLANCQTSQDFELALTSYSLSGQFSGSASSNSNTTSASLSTTITNASCTTVGLEDEDLLEGSGTLVFQSDIGSTEFTLRLNTDLDEGDFDDWSALIRTGAVSMNIEEGTDSWVFENQDEVTLTIDLDDEGDVIDESDESEIGEINFDGTKYGTVTRSSTTSGYVATFTDNDTESFP